MERMKLRPDIQYGMTKTGDIHARHQRDIK